MLSIEKTKELIGDPNLTDEEAERIRDDMRALVEIIFEDWQEKKRDQWQSVADKSVPKQ